MAGNERMTVQEFTGLATDLEGLMNRLSFDGEFVTGQPNAQKDMVIVDSSGHEFSNLHIGVSRGDGGDVYTYGPAYTGGKEDCPAVLQILGALVAAAQAGEVALRRDRWIKTKVGSPDGLVLQRATLLANVSDTYHVGDLPMSRRVSLLLERAGVDQGGYRISFGQHLRGFVEGPRSGVAPAEGVTVTRGVFGDHDPLSELSEEERGALQAHFGSLAVPVMIPLSGKEWDRVIRTADDGHRYLLASA